MVFRSEVSLVRVDVQVLDRNHNAITGLTRDAFVLRDLEEMSTADVARVLGVEPAAVRQRVHRARLMIRGYLGHLVGVQP